MKSEEVIEENLNIDEDIDIDGEIEAMTRHRFVEGTESKNRRTPHQAATVQFNEEQIPDPSNEQVSSISQKRPLQHRTSYHLFGKNLSGKMLISFSRP